MSMKPCWELVKGNEWRCRECGANVSRGSYPTHFGHEVTCSYSAAPILERAEKAEADIQRMREERRHDGRVACPAENDISIIERSLGRGWIGQLARHLERPQSQLDGVGDA